MYDNKRDFIRAKQEPLTMETPPHKSKHKKSTPKRKSDHAHVWECYIEADGPEDEAYIAQVKRCTICGHYGRPKGLGLVTVKHPEYTSLLTLVIHAGDAKRLGLEVRVKQDR